MRSDHADLKGMDIGGSTSNARYQARPLPGEVITRLDSRERRWLARRLLHEMLWDRRFTRFAMVGGSLLLLAGTLWAVPGRVVPAPNWLLGSLGVLGGGFLSIAVHGWFGTLRTELVQHLLRLERCGCCAHPKGVGVTFDARDPWPRSSLRWTCSECGAAWGGGHEDFQEIEYREAA